MAHAEVLLDAFVTADAVDLTFSFDGDDLEVTFKDWSGFRNIVLFPCCVTVRWDDYTPHIAVRDDAPHEVIDSKEVAYLELSADEFHHYILCFNAGTDLEIISKAFKVIKPVAETSESP